jgi:hypothetical protein
LAQTKNQWLDGLTHFMDVKNHKQSSEEVQKYCLEQCLSSVQTETLLKFITEQEPAARNR